MPLHSATRLEAGGLHARAGGKRGCPRLVCPWDHWVLQRTVSRQLNSMCAFVKTALRLPPLPLRAFRLRFQSKSTSYMMKHSCLLHAAEGEVLVVRHTEVVASMSARGLSETTVWQMHKLPT